MGVTEIFHFAQQHVFASLWMTVCVHLYIIAKFFVSLRHQARKQSKRKKNMENKYITVAYKLYTLQDGKEELIEEAPVAHPFQ